MLKPARVGRLRGLGWDLWYLGEEKSASRNRWGSREIERYIKRTRLVSYLCRVVELLQGVAGAFPTAAVHHEGIPPHDCKNRGDTTKIWGTKQPSRNRATPEEHWLSCSRRLLCIIEVGVHFLQYIHELQAAKQTLHNEAGVFTSYLTFCFYNKTIEMFIYDILRQSALLPIPEEGCSYTYTVSKKLIKQNFMSCDFFFEHA